MTNSWTSNLWNRAYCPSKTAIAPSIGWSSVQAVATLERTLFPYPGAFKGGQGTSQWNVSSGKWYVPLLVWVFPSLSHVLVGVLCVNPGLGPGTLRLSMISLRFICVADVSTIPFPPHPYHSWTWKGPFTHQTSMVLEPSCNLRSIC